MSAFQWYPGHMAKAKRQVLESLQQVDGVIELLDARIPASSRNPNIDELVQRKPRLLILNKADLADSKQTTAWTDYFAETYPKVLAISARDRRAWPIVEQALFALFAPLQAKWQKKGIRPRAYRIMILGIPNVGKSTFINQMGRKKSTATGNKPGVTKGQQWIKVGKSFELLDTPGILWPKFEDETVGKKLAITGAIKDSLFPKDDAALFALNHFLDFYPGRIQHAFHVDEGLIRDDLPGFLMEQTKKAGFREDYERMSNKIIMMVRQGKWGRYTLDIPPVAIPDDTEGQRFAKK